MGDPMFCLYCGRPATRLCDATICRPIGDYCKRPGKAPYAVMTMEVMPLATCDAPICDEHCVVVGHICGKDPDVIDHCVKCAQGHEGSLPLVTPDKIPAMRRQLHQQWRRELISGVATHQASEP
jgi:hypothetical protein